ncbi:hypothetical protein [Streptomyces scopuliridis]|uniref:hypothetical protein n=1 Tax=Streptomyces scopuliridis TaxID=452529 RepID=UPI003F56D110
MDSESVDLGPASAHALWRYLLITRRTGDWITTHEPALDAARAVDDVLAEAETLTNPATARMLTGGGVALLHLTQALELSLDRVVAPVMYRLLFRPDGLDTAYARELAAGLVGSAER